MSGHMNADRGRAIVKQIAESVLDQVHALSDRELGALLRAVRKHTRTNVWWVSYDLGPLLDELAANELRHRKPPPPAAPGHTEEGAND